MSEPLPKKQKRAAVNDALRKEICQYSKDHHDTKHDDIVAYFNHKYPELHVSRPTVSKIIKEHAKWLNIEINEASEKSVRHKSVKFPLLDQALSYWVEQVTTAAIEFNDQLIKEKGKEFAKLLGMCENDIQFSNGWIQKFKKRNQLRVYRLHGEAGSVSTESLPEERRKLKEIISKFNPADVYNADETGLFFRMGPNQTLAKRRNAGKKLVYYILLLVIQYIIVN